MRKAAAAAAGYAAALTISHYLLDISVLPLCSAGALLLAAAAVIFFRNERRTGAVLVCLAACAGFIWTWGHYRLFIAPADELAGSEGSVSAVVQDYPVKYDNYSRVCVKLRTEGMPKAKIYVYDYSGSTGTLCPGDAVNMHLRFISAMESRGESTDSYLSSGIYVRAGLKGEAEITGRSRWAFLLFPKVLAHMVKQQVFECFPDDVSGFMCALLTGDKLEFYGDVSSYMGIKIAGLSHVVAVSGMHVAFLIGAVRLFTGKKKGTAVICMPLICVFMAMTGFTPSVVRAGIMQLIMLTGALVDREYDPLTGLSAALLIILLANPQTIGSVSLQLSFAAMAGITLFTPGIYEWMSHDKKKKVQTKNKLQVSPIRRQMLKVMSICASTIGAMIFTVPLSAIHFGVVSTYSVISNVLCLWAVSLAFILGYIVCILGAVWLPLGHAVGLAAAYVPRYIFLVTGVIAKLPWAALYTSDRYVIWFLSSAYGIFILAYIMRDGKHMRPVMPVCACIIVFCGMSLMHIGSVPEHSAVITAVDVGQGQSIAILQHDSTVVIDCGGMNISGSAGERTAEYLSANGRNTVELLVLTHLHADHVNGVEYLMELVDVERIAMPTDADDAGFTEGILELARRHGTEVYYIEENTQVELGELELTLYAPVGSVDTNERGLIILGDYEGYRFLVTGDADSDTEYLFTSLYDLPHLDLLVVGHHGSKYSTCTELLDETTPQTAFISVGYNTYGHPHESVLQRLSQYGIAVYRTDLDGNISMTVGREDG